MASATIERTCQHCNKTFTMFRSYVARGEGRFCSRACQHPRLPLIIKFAQYAHIGTANECWEWQGGKCRDGYGTLRDSRKAQGDTLSSHRVAYALFNGEIPDGMHVRHTCDNPACCNPNHLELGTHADNMRDMNERMRNQQRRLTIEQVRAIRADKRSHAEIAQDYPVARQQISRIKQAIRWKDLA